MFGDVQHQFCPFFLLKAELFIFVELFPCLQMKLMVPLPIHGFVGMIQVWQIRIYQPLATMIDTGKGSGFIYSTNIGDKIRPEFFQGHFFFIAIECPFHTGIDKLLGCVWFCQQAFHQHMNREFDHERNMALTLISWIQQFLNPQTIDFQVIKTQQILWYA